MRERLTFFRGFDGFTAGEELLPDVAARHCRVVHALSEVLWKLHELAPR
jgi:hypothetical protein